MRRRPDNVLTDNDVKQENISENNEINNISENQNIPEDNHDTEAQTEEATTEPEINESAEIIVGSRVKIKPNVGHDILGKRIHNGIKNYVYTVKAVRADKCCTIECMAYQFTLAETDLDLQ